MVQSYKKSQNQIQQEVWSRFPNIQIISEYTGANNKVMLECTDCGYRWETIPRSVVKSKHGCPKCGVAKGLLAKQRDYFLSKYDSSKWELIEFVDNMNVTVKCKVCGNIRQTNANNIYRFGCKKCEMKLHGDKTRLTKEIFVERAKAIHGDKYDYSKVDYTNINTKICIICPKHGEFWQAPSKHLLGQNCPECINESQKSNTEEFVQKARRIHRDKYDYSLVEYNCCHEKVKIICPRHGVFMQTPNAHLEGDGCPRCNESKGETAIHFYLQDLNIIYIPQYLVNNGKRNFKIDFFIENEFGKFAIEYNGKQHYEPVLNFGGLHAFYLQVQRDDDLREFCEKNNIKLYTIRYDEDIKTEMDRIVKEITAVCTSDCIDNDSAKTVNPEMGIPC